MITKELIYMQTHIKKGVQEKYAQLTASLHIELNKTWWHPCTSNTGNPNWLNQPLWAFQATQWPEV